jgi:hypothetical protein
MKSQVLGMLAAAAIGLATSAHAHNIAIGNIIPPGGNAQQASLIHAVDPTLFATGSGVDRAMSASDLSTLSGIAALYSGSVVVLAMDTAAGTSLIVMSDTNFSIGSATASEATAGYESGGMTVLSNGMGGLNAFGGPSPDSGLYAFALTGLEPWATGGVTLAKGSTTDVKFLRWNGAWVVSNTGNYNGSSSSSSLTFNFEVLPVPAPALLAGAGLIGATVVRRRMKKH